MVLYRLFLGRNLFILVRETENISQTNIIVSYVSFLSIDHAAIYLA